MFKKLLAVVVVALATTPALASNDNPFLGANLSLVWNGNSVWSMDVQPDSTGSTATVAGMMVDRTNWDLELTNIFMDADPGIAANFAVFNDTAMTATFNFVVTMPVAFATGGTTTQSGGSTISINDSSGNSTATFASLNPNSVYTASVNGGVARTLFDDPYSLTAAGFAGITNGDTSNFAPEAGPALGLLTELRLEHTFTVTPGDRATVNSSYFIVPEPATLTILALGGIALVRRRR